MAENAQARPRGRRRRFKADNPAHLPARATGTRYDRLVRAGAALGLGVYFNVTGPGPDVGAQEGAEVAARATRDTWKPKTREFFKFVKAVGRRYDGTYRDENDGARVLPRVSLLVDLQRAQPGRLAHAAVGAQGLERRLVAGACTASCGTTAARARRSTGHGNDIVLIGETAPLGSQPAERAQSPMHPKRFIRELFCIDPDGNPLHGQPPRRAQVQPARRRSGRFRYTAWAHHPYTKKLPPTAARHATATRSRWPTSASCAALLDQIAAKTGRARRRATSSMLTEFGYETNPPDPFSGVSLAQQAEYINVGDYLAYKDPRIVGQTQFLLRDVAPVKRAKRNSKRYWFTYQSGLQFADGKPKLAQAAYTLPIHVVGRGTDSVGTDGVNLWGWVRFLPLGTRTQVSLQFKPLGAADYSTIGDPVPVTNAFGFWEAHRAVPVPGTWRAVWIEPVSGTVVVSREATATL